MVRVRLLVITVFAVAMLATGAVPAMAGEWIQSNSVPSYLLWCDWWWNPQNAVTGQAQWEYWCYSSEYDFWVRER